MAGRKRGGGVEIKGGKETRRKGTECTIILSWELGKNVTFVPFKKALLAKSIKYKKGLGGDLKNKKTKNSTYLICYYGFKI